MKLVKKKKKEYGQDKVLGLLCFGVYAICLLYIRFINQIEKLFFNRQLFIIASMFAVIVIVGLNYTMCKGGWPNKALYNQINTFDMSTANKRDIKTQRDILLKVFEGVDYSKNAIAVIIGTEIVACFVILGLFAFDISFANMVTGIIVDIETAVMAYIFYVDTHYKFMIHKNLE